MQFDCVALTHSSGQFLGSELRLGRRLLPEILKDFLGQFMSGLGTALVRQQPFQALLLQTGFAPRRSWDGTDRSLWAALAIGQWSTSSARRVSYLSWSKSSGSKKEDWLKQGMAHLRGTGIESAGGLQGLAFGWRDWVA